jgi:iron complex transport system ATP-binding protein
MLAGPTDSAGPANERSGRPAERDVSLLSAREFAREVTLFSQSHAIPQGLTVGEVVAMGRHPYRRGFAGLDAADRQAIDRAQNLTGVQDMTGRAVGELSGGEVQRVWLAACLAQQTGVVLLDEPTNHLDLRYQVETLDLIRELADEHGVAVGVVLHDLDHAAQVADTVMLLSHGRIHSSGDALEVLTSQNVSEVYEISVHVGLDADSGRLRIDPVGRHPARSRAGAPPPATPTIRKDHP